MNTSKKYHLIVYGCQMNVADGERLAAVLEKNGCKKTSDINKADLILVVMCSVRQPAVDRVLGLAPKFKKLRKGNPGLKTVLTGCILKKDRKVFSGIFDCVLDIKNLAAWPFLRKRGTADFSNIAPKYSSKSSVFVPISNGCNNFCSYCVVPFTRGPLVCRNHEEILKEIRCLAAKRVKEIWLLGQNVNDYQSPADASVGFAELFKMAENIPGNFKILFLSPNPKNFSDKLIKALSLSKKFGRRLNLPVQSGDDKILKKMNRPYTVEKYFVLVEKIRKAIPEINLSTDVIVGFPGETKKQFENTAKLFKKIKFNIAYINKYSPRFGTAAFKMKNDVPWTEKKRREKILMDIINDQ